MNSISTIDWATWVGEMHATLMFIVKDGQILLIEKKRGHGAGKINGPGGKIDPGETSYAAAIRETQEELLITPVAPRKLGELHFHMSDFPDIHCHVYRADDYSGTPTETAEAVPMWTPLDQIPYGRMWDDDQYWLPILLENRTFLGRFIFEADHMLWRELIPDVRW